MLIPQARIGIAERRRPDFVTFVPIQCLKYRWYAIELDGNHTGSDEERNADLASEGYDVLSFRPGTRGYFDEVQRLVEKILADMKEAENNTEAAAIQLRVRHTEPTPPF